MLGSLTGDQSTKTIVITRSHDPLSDYKSSLRFKNVRILELPALVIGPPDQWGPLDDALGILETFNWIVISSANGVRALEERLQIIQLSLADLPEGLKVAAVGKKTASLLETMGAKVDFIPPNFVADSLIENFPESVEQLKILLPRVQSGGRTFLSEALINLGAVVTEVPAYESRCPETMPEETANALANSEVDVIAFTSGKTVMYTVELLKNNFGSHWTNLIDHVKIISIGPQTSLRCRKFFGRVDKEAKTFDMDGLLDASLKVI